MISTMHKILLGTQFIIEPFSCNIECLRHIEMLVDDILFLHLIILLVQARYTNYHIVVLRSFPNQINFQDPAEDAYSWLMFLQAFSACWKPNQTEMKNKINRNEEQN